MAKQVGSATASGAVAGPGSGAASVGSASGEQVVPFVSQIPGTPVHFPSFHGRAVSWVAVSLMCVKLPVFRFRAKLEMLFESRLLTNRDLPSGRSTTDAGIAPVANGEPGTALKRPVAASMLKPAIVFDVRFVT